MEKTMVFIDGNNFYYACKGSGVNIRIDFYKLGFMLTGNARKLVRVYYYNAPREKDESNEDSIKKYAAQQRFFDAIKHMPYVTPVLGRLEKRTRTCKKCSQDTEVYVEKATDINLAVDMVMAAQKKNCDTVILVSADGDFTKAVDAVKELGVNVEIACFRGHSSRHLMEKKDAVHWLDDFDLKTYKRKPEKVKSKS